MRTREFIAPTLDTMVIVSRELDMRSDPAVRKEIYDRLLDPIFTEEVDVKKVRECVMDNMPAVLSKLQAKLASTL